MATGISSQIRGGLPFWTASSGTGSEPQRTKYICESVLYRFLARTKACLEFPLTPISMLYSNIGYYFLCVSAESTWHIPFTSCMSTQCSWDLKLSIGWSEKIQLPEVRILWKLYLPGLPSKYFRPHLVNWDDFSLPAASLLVNPMPGVTFYSPSPNLPAFSVCRLNSLQFSQMGAFN